MVIVEHVQSTCRDIERNKKITHYPVVWSPPLVAFLCVESSWILWCPEGLSVLFRDRKFQWLHLFNVVTLSFTQAQIHLQMELFLAILCLCGSVF